MSVIDESVQRLLKFIGKVASNGIPENAPEETKDTPEARALLRRVATSSIVLLKNEGSVLPFKKDRSIAVIGPNAKITRYCGGGSASLRPYYAISPYDGIRARAENVQYTVGATAYKSLPDAILYLNVDGRTRCRMRFYTEPPSTAGREVVDEMFVETTNLFLVDLHHPKLGALFFAGESLDQSTSHTKRLFRTFHAVNDFFVSYRKLFLVIFSSVKASIGWGCIH